MSDPFTDAHSWADVMYGKDMGDALRRDAAALAAKDAEIERLRVYVEETDYIGGWRKRAEAAEAEVARLTLELTTGVEQVRATVAGEAVIAAAIATERERCARVAEEKERETDCFDDHGAASAACSEIAAAIRAG